MSTDNPSVRQSPATTDATSRFVALQQVFNFRDLGGLPTRDGRRVRSGLVYRSDQFGRATADDIDTLVDTIGLKTVVDLRRPSEVAHTGGFITDRGVKVLNLELKHLAWEGFNRDVTTEPSPIPFLVERYTAMIETGADTIKSTLELMCDATPMVFHCMAGKDRTGITAAIALGLLGVAHDDIAADYELTVQGMSRYRDWLNTQGESGANQWGIEPEAEAMLGLLAAIDRGFGGVDGYAHAIGFTRTQQLREHLLD